MPMLIHLLFLSWYISICTSPFLFLVATCFLSKTSLTVGIPIILCFGITSGITLVSQNLVYLHL